MACGRPVSPSQQTKLEDAILPAAAEILLAAEDMIRTVVADVAARRAAAAKVDVGEVRREPEAAQERLRRPRKLTFATEDDSKETVAHLKKLAAPGQGVGSRRRPRPPRPWTPSRPRPSSARPWTASPTCAALWPSTPAAPARPCTDSSRAALNCCN